MLTNDPGPCPICGAPHSACTTFAGPPTMVQLPARDAAEATTVLVTPVLKAEQIQATLPPNEVTTGTYRGRRKK